MIGADLLAVALDYGLAAVAVVGILVDHLLSKREHRRERENWRETIDALEDAVREQTDALRRRHEAVRADGGDVEDDR